MKLSDMKIELVNIKGDIMYISKYTDKCLSEVLKYIEDTTLNHNTITFLDQYYPSIYDRIGLYGMMQKDRSANYSFSNGIISYNCISSDDISFDSSRFKICGKLPSSANIFNGDTINTLGWGDNNKNLIPILEVSTRSIGAFKK